MLSDLRQLRSGSKSASLNHTDPQDSWDFGTRVSSGGMLARKMHSFPGAAVRNYHELVGLNNRIFLFVCFGGLEV